jgi:hypothetical protein
MKTEKPSFSRLAIAAMVAFFALPPVLAFAAAAGATLTAEDVSDPRACTSVLNSGAAGTTQTTLTIPAVSGMYAYICTYDEFVGATTAPAATLLNTTTTNLGGMRFYNQVAATATQAPGVHFAPAHPFKSSAPGTNTVFTGNAAVTSVNYGAQVTWFYAP